VTTRIRRRFGRAESEDGMGMILVIGIMGLVTALVAVAGSVAVNSITSSRNRVTYEQALATAENGIDYALVKLQKAFDESNADYPMPSPADPGAGCSTTITQTATTDDAQRAEARTVLNQIATTAACRRQGGVGEYVIWKPPTALVSGLYPKYGKVYAMSFVPSYGAAAQVRKVRMLKAEYLFLPYRPTHAVLSGGNLSFDASTKVTAAYGVDPSVASVHTNGSVTTNGNPTVTGVVTSTGTSTAQSNNFTNPLNPGGAVTQTPVQRIPTVDAELLYYRNRNDHPEYAAYSGTTYLGPWYDLCPDGTARPRAATGAPCSATEVLNAGNLNSFRGWTYVASTHIWKASNVTQSGIYYIFEGSADVGNGNTAVDNITVIAQAEGQDSCANKKYGNINWDHYDMRAPSMTNLFMYADSDITTHANWSAGSGATAAPVISGMFVAGDQMQMATSSAGAVGAIVVGNQCQTGNPDLVTSTQIKNPAIYYDPNADAPFTSIISTTLWLEYPGS